MSARSSPTNAQSSQESRRRSSSASNAGSFRAVGSWISSSTASSRARRAVAADSRPLTHSTHTSEPRKKIPTPARDRFTTTAIMHAT